MSGAGYAGYKGRTIPAVLERLWEKVFEPFRQEGIHMAWVLIWEDNMYTFGRSWMGHAALNMGTTWSSDPYNGNPNYVSYVPGDEFDDTKDALGRTAGLKMLADGSGEKAEDKVGAVGNMKKGVMAPGGANSNFLDDLSFEGYLPDHILKIDKLNVGKMRAKWTEINANKDRKYRAVWENCSTIVAGVLVAGEISVTSYARHALFWTPRKIHQLVKAAGGAETKWRSFLTTELNPIGVKWEHLYNDKGKLKGRSYALSTIAASKADCHFS